MEKCPNCNSDMEISMDSMHTIHRCALLFHCPKCEKDFELNGDGRLSEIVRNHCDGCWNNRPGYYHELECMHCHKGSNYQRR